MTMRGLFDHFRDTYKIKLTSISTRGADPVILYGEHFMDTFIFSRMDRILKDLIEEIKKTDVTSKYLTFDVSGVEFKEGSKIMGYNDPDASDDDDDDSDEDDSDDDSDDDDDDDDEGDDLGLPPVTVRIR